MNHKLWGLKVDVATLALGLWPRQGVAKLRVKRNTWESHHMLPGVPKSVREWTLTLPSELQLLGVGIPMDSWIFRTRFQGSQPIASKSFLYHWQFDSWSLKVKNQPDFLACRQRATYH
jgi:hypothetical protein